MLIFIQHNCDKCIFLDDKVKLPGGFIRKKDSKVTEQGTRINFYEISFVS